jgi:hypothetical protein
VFCHLNLKWFSIEKLSSYSLKITALAGAYDNRQRQFSPQAVASVACLC